MRVHGVYVNAKDRIFYWYGRVFKREIGHMQTYEHTLLNWRNGFLIYRNDSHYIYIYVCVCVCVVVLIISQRKTFRFLNAKY